MIAQRWEKRMCSNLAQMKDKHLLYGNTSTFNVFEVYMWNFTRYSAISSKNSILIENIIFSVVRSIMLFRHIFIKIADLRVKNQIFNGKQKRNYEISWKHDFSWFQVSIASWFLENMQFSWIFTSLANHRKIYVALILRSIRSKLSLRTNRMCFVLWNICFTPRRWHQIIKFAEPGFHFFKVSHHNRHKYKMQTLESKTIFLFLFTKVVSMLPLIFMKIWDFRIF